MSNTVDKLQLLRTRHNDAAESPAHGMDRTLPPKSFTHRYGIPALAMVVVIGTATALFMHYGRADILYVDKDRVTLASVQRTPFQEFIPLTGTVAPVDSVFVDIAEPGQVAEIFVGAGDIVEAGQVLVRLSSTAPENELMNSENLLAQQVNALSGTKLQYEQTRLGTERNIIDMRADLEKVTAGYQRMLRIRDSGAIKQADIDDSLIEIKRQQQSLAAMEKSLALSESEGRKQIDTMQRVIDALSSKLTLARKNLDTLQVRAPIRGQLISFNVHVGQRVIPAQRIGQINQVDKTKIVASVDEFYLNRVSMNQAATLVMDGKTYQLKMTKIYPEVHDRVFNVDFAFAGDSVGNMRIGQSMELRLGTSAFHEILAVTNGPFYESSDHGVFVVGEHGQIATRRNVAFGRRNTDYVEILEGVAAGEQIITSSYQTFKGINQLRFR